MTDTPSPEVGSAVEPEQVKEATPEQTPEQVTDREVGSEDAPASN